MFKGKLFISRQLVALSVMVAIMCGNLVQAQVTNPPESEGIVNSTVNFSPAVNHESSLIEQSMGGIPEQYGLSSNSKRVLDLENRVFGDWMFTGQFAQQQFVGFNPNYEIASGDHIEIRMWGGYVFDGKLNVDNQGNLFLPQIGPILVRGVQNKDLNEFVAKSVTKVFKTNVGVYASLVGAEPVKVFVTGYVAEPGLYAGHSADSVLRFIDLAGGITSDKGSYISISVLRQGKLHKNINLYEFLLEGKLPVFQIFDGDTILVGASKSSVTVTGLVKNPFKFEFTNKDIPLSEVLDYARVNSGATHIRLSRNNLMKREVEYIPLSKAEGVITHSGDIVDVVSDKTPGTISVRVEGEHNSRQEYILPYGSNLGDLLKQVTYTANAQPEAVQLFRASVKERQEAMLMQQLRALESSVLNARSSTREEAALRTQEAALVMKWVNRAKDVDLKGQVILGGVTAKGEILLEGGDVIRIPRRSNLVMVHGDVLFPSAMGYEDSRTPKDYIDLAGGFVAKSNQSLILIMHRDGTFDKVNARKLDSRRTGLNPGDEIFVLPRVQDKYMQWTKDITQVLYQIAISAGVILRL